MTERPRLHRIIADRSWTDPEPDTLHVSVQTSNETGDLFITFTCSSTWLTPKVVHREVIPWMEWCVLRAEHADATDKDWAEVYGTWLDDRFDDWHNYCATLGRELAEHLAMTAEEYEAWAAYGTLPERPRVRPQSKPQSRAPRRPNNAEGK